MLKLNSLLTLFATVLVIHSTLAQDEARVSEILNRGKRLELQELACNHPDMAIRKKAIDKIQAESIIKYVAYTAPCSKLRSYATLRLNDPITLKEIVLRDSSVLVCKHALTRLKSQYLLKQIALYKNIPSVRKVAVSKLTSEEDLVYFAIHDPDKQVRDMANMKLNLLSKKSLTSKVDMPIK